MRRGHEPPVYRPLWERAESSGAHAALCRLLDVTAAYPLDIVIAEDSRPCGRKTRAPILMPLTFLPVPPR